MAKSQIDYSGAPPYLAVVDGRELPLRAMASSEQAPVALTPLQTRVTREILTLVRRDDLALGDRLAESVLAERIGTSRTPVNVALHHLVTLGVVYYDTNRGFFMAKSAREVTDVASQFFDEPEEPLYLKIAADRLARRLPDVVSEADLMRQYEVSRSALRRVLSLMQEEGWLERQVGHGWQFMPMIDSVEAYEESYLFRAAIEPTGILSPTFSANRVELEALKRRQQFIVDGGYLTMNSIELFEANSEFHETIAKWSGNRFIAQSVRRMDRLRRLVEYRQAKARKPRQGQALEHLAILEAIAGQDLLKAAALLRDHIEGARRAKVHAQEVFEA
ncbi:DNA-binding transcriptional regulator, GntR family [Paraburkholderia steynii]|uniref:DNA-binding transcriptional regulator, GntR family n=1 Tax=Paraburkholderia steynii TaxID=1245441 RepID=A0A7Z7FN52_9BURK|nr:GntR family transcriptional regulator [Paraburkholderia steynii]SDJ15574.1 DNA-binding transcriptional regulator, GntR family [Paraburkholderia steynii]